MTAPTDDHRSSRRPSAARPPSIAVLAPVLGGFYFGGLLAGTARAAAARRHGVVAIQTMAAGLERVGEDHAVSRFSLPLAQHEVAGYVVVTTAVARAQLERIYATGKPVVLVSGEVASVPVPVVLPDNSGGVRQAVDHLVAHGHRRIGFAGHLWLTDVRERYAAYQEALAEHGIEPDPAWLFEAPDNLESGGAVAAERMLAQGVPTTAVIAATDRNAAGLIAKLRAAGLELPRRQAVIGFDNTELGARLRPALTTVDQHVDRLGDLAVRLLLARVRGEVMPSRAYRSGTSLVRRESCGCGPAAAEVGPAAPLDARLTPAERFRERATAALVGTAPSHRPADRTAAAIKALTEVLAAAGVGRPADPERVVRIMRALVAPDPPEEALDLLVGALRAFGRETLDVPDEPPRVQVRQVHEAVTEALTALTTARGHLGRRRAGALEAAAVAQYEVDMDLLRRGGADPRSLDWLPAGRVTAACLALWSGEPEADGDRPLEIVGARDEGGRLGSLVGTRHTASAFPPAVLCRLALAHPRHLVCIVPVRVDESDWGLLAVVGPVDARGTSAREVYNHWAALLAVALDGEELLQSLRQRQRDLAEAYGREKALLAEVRASEERYALAAEAASDGLWDWDVSAGRVFYSARWAAMLGHRDAEIGDAPGEWLDRVHPEDRTAVATAVAAQLGGGQPSLEVEHRLRASDGSYRWVLCRARMIVDAAGTPARLVGAMSDITHRRQLEEQLHHGALYDAVTGLPNRVLFHDRLTTAAARSRRPEEYAFAVAVVGVRSASIDGRVRQAEEDVVRREAAARIRASLRDGDTAAWLGNGEFAALLDGITPDEATGVADRVRAALATRMPTDEGDLELDVHLGVVTNRGQPTSADGILQAAHTAAARARARDGKAGAED